MTSNDCLFAADLFSLLSLADRVRMLSLLEGNDASVTELSESIEMSESQGSKLIRPLADAGLAKAVRDGNKKLYSLTPKGKAILRIIETLAD